MWEEKSWIAYQRCLIWVIRNVCKSLIHCFYSHFSFHYSSLAKVDYDHIEVSLEDPSAIASATDEDSKEILTRANDFFLEYNDNYTMNWTEAIELDQDLDADPSKPPQPGM